jgi:hypothetical protein
MMLLKKQFTICFTFVVYIDNGMIPHFSAIIQCFTAIYQVVNFNLFIGLFFDAKRFNCIFLEQRIVLLFIIIKPIDALLDKDYDMNVASEIGQIGYFEV